MLIRAARLAAYRIMVLASLTVASMAMAQTYSPPDRESPGDEMIQAYLAHETEKLSAGFAADITSLKDWSDKRPQYIEEYFYMLGLSPRPENTPLKATITGSIPGV